MAEPAWTPPEVATGTEETISPAEVRARRTLIVGLVVAGVVLAAMVALVVVLAIDAYGAAPEKSPGGAVISLLRDAAIVLVAFETMIIGVLLVVLTLQVQALVVLLRDEIRPMLEAVNETVATVRGTTQFMAQTVVSPTIRAAGFLAGLQRIVREVKDFVRRPEGGAGEP